MPSKQFQHILEHELERLQSIRVCTEHGILYAYMSTRDYYPKPLKRSSLYKKFFATKLV